MIRGEMFRRNASELVTNVPSPSVHVRALRMTTNALYARVQSALQMRLS